MNGSWMRSCGGRAAKEPHGVIWVLWDRRGRRTLGGETAAILRGGSRRDWIREENLTGDHRGRGRSWLSWRARALDLR